MVGGRTYCGWCHMVFFRIKFFESGVSNDIFVFSVVRFKCHRVLSGKEFIRSVIRTFVYLFADSTYLMQYTGSGVS